MHIAVCGPLEKVGEGQRGDDAFVPVSTQTFAVPLRECERHRRKASIGEHIDDLITSLFGNHRLDDILIWPIFPQQVSIEWHRFDMDATPTLVVEPSANGIDDRMLRSQIDVSAILHALQCPPEKYVLEILGIRFHRQVTTLLMHSVKAPEVTLVPNDPKTSQDR